MSWGTEIMALGKTPATSKTQGPLVKPATSSELRPVDWSYTLGSYAGAWAGGGTVGYIAARNPQGALKGGLAASGIWGIGEALTYARERDVWLTGLFVTLSAGSLWYAWRK